MAKLTAKQKKFVEEYLIDLNATQAAIRAGYSTESAKEIGCENLTKPNVKAEIDKAIAERSRRTGINQDRVLRELAKIAFVNPGDVINLNQATVKSDAKEEDLAAIASVKIKNIPTEDGEITEREIKLCDKLKALDLLGKHLGIYDKKDAEDKNLTITINKASEKMEINITCNDHFEDFVLDWNYKFYFLVGGYGSSKSYHVVQKLHLKLLQEKRLALVVREVYDTIRDSCFSLLQDVAVDMGIYDMLKFKTSPMQVTYPNGSKIIFKGMDKPAKLKSINGVSIIWVEECSEVKYEGFKELLGRLRHPTLSNHIILSENPIEKANWTYKHFFIDEENNKKILDDEKLYIERIIKTNNTYYHHSICDDNYFLPQDYIKELDNMKEYDPDLYRVARQGRFGINGTKVLPQFEMMDHDLVMAKVGSIPSRFYRAGMDFGFETSYNALVRIAIDDVNKDLYIYWEYYKNHMTDDKTAKEIDEFRVNKELIRADSA